VALGRHARFVGTALALGLAAAHPACTDRDAPRPVPAFEGGSGDGSGPMASHPTAAPPDVRAVMETPPPAPAVGALPAGLPDPAEAGISDLARLARYVFREMQRHEQACALTNPFHDTLAFTIEIEVKGGRIVSARVGEAALERSGERVPVPGGTPPAELVAYVGCLRPVLEGIPMAPAPADGVYRPEYAYPGHAGP